MFTVRIFVVVFVLSIFPLFSYAGASFKEIKSAFPAIDEDLYDKSRGSFDFYYAMELKKRFSDLDFLTALAVTSKYNRKRLLLAIQNQPKDSLQTVLSSFREEDVNQSKSEGKSAIETIFSSERDENEKFYEEFCKSDKRISALDGVVNTQARKRWQDIVTHPTQHSREKFTYIVHAIKPSSANANGIEKFFSDPLGIQDRIISASIIDQDKSNTYASACGVVLDVPSANIVAMSSSDLGANNSVYEDIGKDGENKAFDIKVCTELTRLNNEYPIDTPAAVLAETKKYNELAILGTHPVETSSTVGISAVFVRKVFGQENCGSVFIKGKKVSLADELKAVSKKLQVPVIEF